MPYVKTDRDSMSKLLGAYGLENSARLATLINASKSTAYKRIKNPEELTVWELRRLNTHGHIPIEDIRNAL